MTIKFDTIKRNAVREFIEGIALVGEAHRTGGNSEFPESTVFLALQEAVAAGRPSREILEEWRDYGERLINAWDVRCVAKLIELFPSSVPAAMHGKRLTADYNEAGDWAVSDTP